MLQLEASSLTPLQVIYHKAAVEALGLKKKITYNRRKIQALSPNPDLVDAIMTQQRKGTRLFTRQRFKAALKQYQEAYTRSMDQQFHPKYGTKYTPKFLYDMTNTCLKLKRFPAGKKVFTFAIGITR